MVWCTPGGGTPHVPGLQEHSYCILEGQLEVIIVSKEEEQTTSVYQNNHSTPPILLEHRMHEHTCMELRKLEKVLINIHKLQFLKLLVELYIGFP